mmetsp:Transcript_15198/g.29621  ORF Transcript_15198/g.29621 Transcript_15198/m.29621 type:complete len:627 (-) Transcript_15198:869-2749(-)
MNQTRVLELHHCVERTTFINEEKQIVRPTRQRPNVPHPFSPCKLFALPRQPFRGHTPRRTKAQTPQHGIFPTEHPPENGGDPGPQRMTDHPKPKLRKLPRRHRLVQQTVTFQFVVNPLGSRQHPCVTLFVFPIRIQSAFATEIFPQRRRRDGHVRNHIFETERPADGQDDGLPLPIHQYDVGTDAQIVIEIGVQNIRFPYPDRFEHRGLLPSAAIVSDDVLAATSARPPSIQRIRRQFATSRAFASVYVQHPGIGRQGHAGEAGAFSQDLSVDEVVLGEDAADGGFEEFDGVGAEEAEGEGVAEGVVVFFGGGVGGVDEFAEGVDFGGVGGGRGGERGFGVVGCGWVTFVSNLSIVVYFVVVYFVVSVEQGSLLQHGRNFGSESFRRKELKPHRLSLRRHDRRRPGHSHFDVLFESTVERVRLRMRSRMGNRFRLRIGMPGSRRNIPKRRLSLRMFLVMISILISMLTRIALPFLLLRLPKRPQQLPHQRLILRQHPSFLHQLIPTLDLLPLLNIDQTNHGRGNVRRNNVETSFVSQEIRQSHRHVDVTPGRELLSPEEVAGEEAGAFAASLAGFFPRFFRVGGVVWFAVSLPSSPMAVPKGSPSFPHDDGQGEEREQDIARHDED